MQRGAVDRDGVVLDRGEAVFDELRARWAERSGADELVGLETLLRTLVGDQVVDPGHPGWVGDDPV